MKTLLCLTILGLFVFMVWSAYFVFQQKEHPIWGTNATTGALAVLLSIIALSIGIRVLRSRRYRRSAPSFTLAFFTTVAVFLVFAFAGVEPMTEYKDEAIDSLKSAFQGSGKYDLPSIPKQAATGANPSATIAAETQYGVTKMIGGVWAITLDGVKWKNSTLHVDLTIENRGTKRATFGYRGEGLSLGASFMTKDSMNNWADMEENLPSPEEFPEALRDAWLYGEEWGMWFQGDYWPGDTRQGEVKFEMGPQSQGVALYGYFAGIYGDSRITAIRFASLKPDFRLQGLRQRHLAVLH